MRSSVRTAFLLHWIMSLLLRVTASAIQATTRVYWRVRSRQDWMLRAWQDTTTRLIITITAGVSSRQGARTIWAVLTWNILPITLSAPRSSGSVFIQRAGKVPRQRLIRIHTTMRDGWPWQSISWTAMPKLRWQVIRMTSWGGCRQKAFTAVRPTNRRTIIISATGWRASAGASLRRTCTTTRAAVRRNMAGQWYFLFYRIWMSAFYQITCRGRVCLPECATDISVDVFQGWEGVFEARNCLYCFNESEFQSSIE